MGSSPSQTVPPPQKSIQQQAPRGRRPSAPNSAAGTNSMYHRPTSIEVTSHARDSVTANGNMPTALGPVPLMYPTPTPFRRRKVDLFQIEKYEALDKYACQLPESLLSQSYSAVADYLTRNARNDLDKVRAVFRWIASVDVSALQHRTVQLPDIGTPLDYLLKINWKMGNHANFTAQLARAAGLPCVVINGINKSAAYQLGRPIERRTLSAQWNAVYADGEWRLLDAFWASTCLIGRCTADWALIDVDGQQVDSPEQEDDGETLHTVNEFFFIPDPDHLVATHLPDDPAWQLLDRPVTFQEFESSVYIRDRFFQLGLVITEERLKFGVISTKRGLTTISLSMSPEQSSKYDFRYLLFKSKQTSDRSIPYERFIMYEKKSDCISYTTRFPVAGRFKLDVFGVELGVHDSYDLVCSYLLDCNDPDTSLKPLPDCPTIGWGPNDVTQQAGLTATSHKQAVIETSDGKVDIWFKLDPRVKAVLQSILHNDLDEWLLARNAVLREANGQLVISVRLPNKGEYAVKLFAELNDLKMEPDLQNVCNYLIRCLNNNGQLQPFPRLHEGILGEGPLAKSLGVTAVSHTDSLITTDDGKLQLKFATKSSDLELVCEVNSNGADKSLLANSVSRSTDGLNTQFDLELPGQGEYAVNVFAYHKNDPSRLHHVYTYLVTSNQKSRSNNDSRGESSEDIKHLTTDKDTVVLRLPAQDQLKAELRRKNAAVDDVDKVNKFKSEQDGDEQVLTVQLADYGEYRLDVYESRGSGGLQHKQTYIINRVEQLQEQQQHEEDQNKDNENNDIQQEQEHEVELSEEDKEKLEKDKAEDAERRVRRAALRDAMASQDIDQLRLAIQQMESQGVRGADIIILDQAKKMLQFLLLTRDLTEAMRLRKLTMLEQAVAAAEKSGLEKRLGIQLAMAQRILEQLRRIEKLRHAILNLDQRTIAEIKSYSQPPPAVYKVMQAAFMLLGEQEKNLKDWRNVQVLIGKTGKESLKRRVSDFDVEKLAINLALKVKEMLSSYQLNEIRDTSAGAATFYVWSLGMIEEAESRFAQTT